MRPLLIVTAIVAASVLSGGANQRAGAEAEVASAGVSDLRVQAAPSGDAAADQSPEARQYAPGPEATANDELLAATASGDVEAVTALLDQGVDINAEFGWRRGVTPLYVAADRAKVALVKLLLERGADPSVQDLEWGMTPLEVTARPWSDIQEPEARAAIVRLLVEQGAGTDGGALVDLLRAGHFDAVRTIIGRGGLNPSYANQALAIAIRAEQPEIVDLLVKAGARDPGPIDSPRSPERLQLTTGRYRTPSGQTVLLRTSSDEEELLLEWEGGRGVALRPADLNLLRSQDMKVVVRFNGAVLPPPDLTLSDGGQSMSLTRIGDAPPRTAAAPAAPRRAAPIPVPKAATVASHNPRQWPSFRGHGGAGVAEGVRPPTEWDLQQGINIKWKTPIQGLAHSSPVIWDDRVFVTGAAPTSDASLTFRHSGNYSTLDSGMGGAVASTKDDVEHSWRVYALDRQTGKIIWERVAHEGIPRTDRHVNQSQADATPVTNGQQLVVFFGSEGLYCYDLNGQLLWKKDLGALGSGYTVDPTYEWVTSSSPIIYENRVILQVDVLKTAYLVAFAVETGEELWRAVRDEGPSWATPFLYEDGVHTELVTVATNYARGYDPNTGQELWRLGGHSSWTAPTPIAGLGLIFITSGSGGTIQPIYAVRPGARGDITLKYNERSNDYIAWSTTRGGSFMPTPILYGDILYVSSSSGILAAYRPETGERLYRERLTRGGSFSASGVAADGKLYFPSENGDVIVVKAGPTFERLAVNPMGEVMMATPAISDDMMVIRTQHHVVAVAAPATSQPVPR